MGRLCFCLAFALVLSSLSVANGFRLNRKPSQLARSHQESDDDQAALIEQEVHVHKAPRASLLVRGQASSTQKRDILVLVAPPAGGKGTQSEKIAKLMNIPHLSTGDMLRGEVAKGTEIGKQAQEAMSSGSLVSDELVIKIVQSRISEEDCKHGFILDGFPRTVPQAEALDRMLGESGEEVGKIINLEVPDDVVIKRITGRWIHKPSGRSYHVLWKRPESLGDKEVSPETMLDDVTGEPLTQRKDDTKEAAVNRIAKYYSQTQPILAHYRGKGKGGDISTINGDQGIDEVAANIAEVLTATTTDSLMQNHVDKDEEASQQCAIPSEGWCCQFLGDCADPEFIDDNCSCTPKGLIKRCYKNWTRCGEDMCTKLKKSCEKYSDGSCKIFDARC